MRIATVHLKQIYDKAILEGDLEQVATKTIRDSDVIKKIKWLHSNFDVTMFGYDPYKMTEIAEDLEDLGYPMVAVSQGTGNMSEPAEKLETIINEGIFKFSNSLFEYACSCAMAKISNHDNIQIVRENSAIDKIDPLVATIIAMSCATLQKVDTNIYESRGLICG
jgi:phage terminase large subunit-like protein